MNRYIPPSFPLYEFAPEGRADGPERRWLWHWDGRVSAPAADVILAWASGEATALVCTTSRVFDAAYARFRAAHLALGGTFLPAALQLSGSTRIVRAMERFRDDDSLWSPIPGLVPGATHAEAAAGDGYVIAYTQFDGGTASVTATGVPLEHFRVRVAQG
jgi:hypothetical protein